MATMAVTMATMAVTMAAAGGDYGDNGGDDGDNGGDDGGCDGIFTIITTGLVTMPGIVKEIDRYSSYIILI